MKVSIMIHRGDGYSASGASNEPTKANKARGSWARPAISSNFGACPEGTRRARRRWNGCAVGSDEGCGRRGRWTSPTASPALHVRGGPVLCPGCLSLGRRHPRELEDLGRVRLQHRLQLLRLVSRRPPLDGPRLRLMQRLPRGPLPAQRLGGCGLHTLQPRSRPRRPQLAERGWPHTR